MKPRIENGYLRNIATKILDNLHALQFGPNVQWRKLGGFRQSRSTPRA